MTSDAVTDPVRRCILQDVSRDRRPDRQTPRPARIYQSPRRRAAIYRFVLAIRTRIFNRLTSEAYERGSDHRLTIHWDHLPAFVEAFPLLHVEPSLYVIDRRRMTCAGGVAGLDLAIELIEREQGQQLAGQVSEWLIGAEPRAAEAPQRSSLRERYGVNDDRILKVLARMESAIENRKSREEFAKIAGLSVRQLERLFVKLLGHTLHETYLNIRLDQADQLILKTGMSATAIGLSCGFNSVSHFSRAFKARFGRSPSAHRKALR